MPAVLTTERNMSPIGIFFASETGSTAEVARLIQQQYLPEGTSTVHDLDEADAAQMDGYEALLFATSTTGCGELPAPLEAFLPELDDVDFEDKVVALVGLGDQVGYPDEFADALGFLYEELRGRGAEVVGFWPTAGYRYERSRADLGDGTFCGLVLDQENQAELTPHRLTSWVESVRADLLAGGSIGTTVAAGRAA
jgi:flavodoxin I